MYLEDKLNVVEDKYLGVIDTYNMYIKRYEQLEQYEKIPKLKKALYVAIDEYEAFHLQNFESEGRRIVRKAYRILGYNPERPKKAL